MTRDDLPSEKDNYNVWCERCQRVHRYYTYTQEDHDKVISEAVQRLADEIDKQALEYALQKLNEQA